MIKVLTKYEDIDKNQWNDLLYNRSSVTSFFQSLEAYELYAPFDWAESAITATEEEGILTGVIVATIHHEKKGIGGYLTSRAIINGGPLLDDTISEESLNALLKATIMNLKKRCVYIETRNYNDYSKWRGIFEIHGFQYQPHYNFHVDTSVPELIEKNFSKSRRYELKESTKAGAYIDEQSDYIPDFYKILKNIYLTKTHTPLPPLNFFEHLAKQHYCHIFIVHTPDGDVIGGQVAIFLKDKVGYDWYCCGKDHDYKKIHPSVMATHSGIKYAAEHGYHLFDMMGAGCPGDNGYGVRDFKAQFGGELVEHGRFLYLCRPLIYKTAKWALNLRKKL